MVNTIEFNGHSYLDLQSRGNAARFVSPFAKELCKGIGYDIGYCKEEWKLPGSVGIDLSCPDKYHADNLPEGQVDYIFSSHCLEHVPNWSKTLELWVSRIKLGGTLFLYLPHYDQEYWRPWNNDKHIHVLSKEIVSDRLKSLGVSSIYTSDRDLLHSFAVVAEI